MAWDAQSETQAPRREQRGEPERTPGEEVGRPQRGRPERRVEEVRHPKLVCIGGVRGI